MLSTKQPCPCSQAISWHVRRQSGEHGESGWDRWEKAFGRLAYTRQPTRLMLVCFSVCLNPSGPPVARCISCADHGRLRCKGGNHGSWHGELGEQRAARLRKPGTSAASCTGARLRASLEHSPTPTRLQMPTMCNYAHVHPRSLHDIVDIVRCVCMYVRRYVFSAYERNIEPAAILEHETALHTMWAFEICGSPTLKPQSGEWFDCRARLHR